MSRHFPSPETATLTLPDGSTLEVKKRITAGEETDSFARTLDQKSGNQRVHPKQIHMALVTCYLLDWNLVGDEGDEPAPPIKGKPIDEVEAILRNLDAGTWGDIIEAIKAHELSIEEARAARKKTQGGKPGGGPSLPSPSAPDGIPSGSTT